MSKTRLEVPGLGTLIGIDELSQLTGISKHTIRSWRKPENSHLAKFRFVRNPHNQNLFYRLDEVENWLAEQGFDQSTMSVSWTYQEGASNAVVLPPQKEVDPRKRELLTRLQKITTENAWTLFRSLDPADKGSRKCFNLSMEGFRKANEQWTASNPDDPETFSTIHLADMPYSKNMFPMRKHFDANPESVAELARWFYVLVNSQRIRIADLTPGILSAAEICQIPIGSVPPTNESLK